ncbi:uncharacterized protein LOC115219789 [Octopus sinensis]|uniref:Uncharacterized protein LOC115219789 n=1 Tax=Octopus sinensis TaxID=2607531 RepID=A0A6P7T674_9MOLL|nr:uncharacterized protein LOC115219789 [Octopus sinensis]
MAGSDQPFFTVFRGLAKKLDNFSTQTNSLTKSEKKFQSLQCIKELSKDLGNKVLECNSLHQDLQNSYVQFRSITDLTSMILEQQKTIIKEQESFLEEHGYIPYRKQQPTPSKVKDEQDDDDDDDVDNPVEEKEASTPENASNNKVPDEKGSPQTPQLKDFGVSHYTIAQLQRPNNACKSHESYSNYNSSSNYVSTPANFQHNGLFMSPSVLGKIPPLFTPDTSSVLRRGTKLYKTPNYFDVMSYSSQKKARLEEKPSHSIRKKLEMPINEETSSKEQSLEPPQLNNSNLQQSLDSDMFFMPSTPQLGNRKTLVNYSKDSAVGELPMPPSLTRTLRSHTSKPGQHDKSVELRNPETPKLENVEEFKLPTPPLLHTTFISMEPGSIRKGSKSFLSNLADVDFIPEAPKLNMNYESKCRRTRTKKEFPL